MPIESRPLAPVERRRVLAAVLVISCAMLSFEILQMVVLSLEVFPESAFLVISLSMLGLGSGSSLAFALGRTRRIDPLAWMWLSALGFAIAELLAMAATSRTHALLPLIVINIVPFVFLGLFLAIAFGAWPERVNQIYFIDLLGAGLGCLVIVALLNALASAGIVVLVVS